MLVAPKIFLLAVQGGISYMDHLCFCVLCFSCFRVCSLLPCGQLLGFFLVMFIEFLLLSHVVPWVRCVT